MSSVISYYRTHRRKPFNPCMSDCDDERRLGRVSGLEVKVGVSEWHQPSYDDDAADIEEQDADIDSTNSFG